MPSLNTFLRGFEMPVLSKRVELTNDEQPNASPGNNLEEIQYEKQHKNHGTDGSEPARSANNETAQKQPIVYWKRNLQCGSIHCQY